MTWLFGTPPPIQYVPLQEGAQQRPRVANSHRRAAGSQMTEAQIIARLSPERRAARELEMRRERARYLPIAERIDTARHEAGHAAVALALGCWVRAVSIVPDGDRAGHCDVIHRRTLDGWGDELREELERRAKIDVAGALAARTRPWDTVDEIAPHEASSAWELVRQAHPYRVPEEMRALTRRTAELLATPLHRDRFSLLAAALVARLELDENEVLEVIAPAGERTLEAMARVADAERLVGGLAA